MNVKKIKEEINTNLKENSEAEIQLEIRQISEIRKVLSKKEDELAQIYVTFVPLPFKKNDIVLYKYVQYKVVSYFMKCIKSKFELMYVLEGEQGRIREIMARSLKPLNEKIVLGKGPIRKCRSLS